MILCCIFADVMDAIATGAMLLPWKRVVQHSLSDTKWVVSIDYFWDEDFP